MAHDAINDDFSHISYFFFPKNSFYVFCKASVWKQTYLSNIYLSCIADILRAYNHVLFEFLILFFPIFNPCGWLREFVQALNTHADAFQKQRLIVYSHASNISSFHSFVLSNPDADINITVLSAGPPLLLTLV